MIWHEKCFKILGLKCLPKESKTHPTLRNIMNSSLQSQQKSQVSLLAKKPVFESASVWIGKCSCLSSDLHTLAPQGWPEGCMQGGKLAESGTQHTLPLPRGVFQRYHRARSSMAGGGSQWQNWQCTLHSSMAHGQRGQLEFLLCTEKHFPRPKTLWKRENSFPLSCLLRKTHCQERCRWCRQAGTLLQQVRAETFWERECSCERSSSRQPGRVQLDWCALCVLCASLWCFWGSSLEQGLAQPCCSLSQQPRELHSSALQPHCKAQAPSGLCLSWAGLADDLFRNNSSAPYSFYLCSCFSSLIYHAKEVMVRAVLWPVAPMSARKGGLGPPSRAQQQRVTHSESKGADRAQGNSTCHQQHPVATSSRNPPVKTPLPLGDENGHNFHIALIFLQHEAPLRPALGQHSCVLPPTKAKWGKIEFNSTVVILKVFF